MTETKYCSECEEKIPISALNCPFCNVKQYADFEIEKPKIGKRKDIATFLAFILGSFGLHKFYLEDYIWGVIYLCLSLTLIPSILAIYDGIILVRMKEDEFNNKYNKGIK